MMLPVLVFDLDRTLYPLTFSIFPQIVQRSEAYIMRHFAVSATEAADLRIKLAQNLYNLKAVFGECQLSSCDFMTEICDVDVSSLQPNPELSKLLSELPNPKYIFSDSSRNHIDTTLAQLQLDSHLFTGIHDYADSNCLFKEQQECHQRFVERFKLNPSQCILFEDNVINLSGAKALGMTTVLITEQPIANEFIDYWFPDIVTALQTLVG